MKAIFSIIALGTVSLLSADCPNGNCGMNYYNSQAGYQGQGHSYRDQPQYQNQGQGYHDQGQYRQQSQNQRQGNYNQPQGNYNQGYYNQPVQGHYNQPSQDGNYNRNDQYQRNQNAQYQGQDNQGYYDSQRYSDDNKGYYNTNRDNNDQNYDNRDNLNVSDADINKEIKDLLAAGMFSNGYPNARFEVNNGNVSLTGTVETLDDRTKIEDKVRKIKGVKNVNNQITTQEKQTVNGNSDTYGTSTKNRNVNDANLREAEKNYPQDTAASDADRLLNARIREKISNGWFTKSYEVVTLRTNNGVVTLVGFVDSNEDIKKINDKLKDIDGIRSVNNQINVKSK